jgi:hypothetical protein
MFSVIGLLPRCARRPAQLPHGARTSEQLAAADFAGRERIRPALSSLGQAIHIYRLRRGDGSEVVIAIADSEQILLDAQKAIMATKLLPGEDR